MEIKEELKEELNNNVSDEKTQNEEKNSNDTNLNEESNKKIENAKKETKEKKSSNNQNNKKKKNNKKKNTANNSNNNNNKDNNNSSKIEDKDKDKEINKDETEEIIKESTEESIEESVQKTDKETDKEPVKETIKETNKKTNKKSGKTDNKEKNVKDLNNKSDKTEESEKTEKTSKDNTNQIFDKDLNSSKIPKENLTNEIINSNPISKRTKIIIGISCLCAIILLFIFSTIFALINLNSDKIISGISIKGVDVSGLTKEEAKEKLNAIVEKKISSNFNFVYGDYKKTINGQFIESNFDIDSSVNTAFNIGRNKNIFVDNFEIISTKLSNLDITPSLTFNEDTFNNLLSEMQNNLPNKLIEPSFYIDEENLVITKGIDGIVIDSDLLKLKLITSINDFDNNNDIEIPVFNSKAKEIDIDEIHSKVYKEPKDAYFTSNPFCIYPHEMGIDFAISIDEAKALVKGNEESYIIPLQYLSPNITTKQIGDEAFPDVLAEYSTTYNTGNYNRSTNISLSSSKIDGTVVMPGEIFSYNATVGKRTAAAGYREAGVYVGGKVTTGIGGGICQVSSTLYNSVLLSNLEIVERYNHAFNPGYVPAGRDATVSWGGPDFQFRNNRNYPIKIICSGTGGEVYVKILGLKEENDYEVEIESYITSYIPYSTIEEPDDTLPTGEQQVIESGSSGCRSVCYKILMKNGEVVSKELVSADSYSPHDRIIAIGT